MPDILTDDPKRAEELRALLKDDCERARKAAALPENDRAGKYRKAIIALNDRLRKNGTEFLRMMVFCGFCAPLKNEAFMNEWLRGWLKSDAVQHRISGAGDLLRRGDYEAFMELARELRENGREIILKYGGYEYGGET